MIKVCLIFLIAIYVARVLRLFAGAQPGADIVTCRHALENVLNPSAGDNGFCARASRQPGRPELGNHAAAAQSTPLSRHGIKASIEHLTLLYHFCLRVVPRIFLEQTSLVSQQHQCIGINQVRDQCGQCIVVTEANLVGDNRIILSEISESK